MTEVHPDFGELYLYSDHKRGDIVTFRIEDNKEMVGEIIWVSRGGPLPSSNRTMPPHYWIIEEHEGFPRAVLFSDIVIVEESALEYCPYCLGVHPKGTIAQCPLYNPNR